VSPQVRCEGQAAWTSRGARKIQPMDIHILHGDIHLTDLRTRMPFKYGIATMTSTPHAFLRLRMEIGGKLAVGIAADSLPPKWFTKDPARPLAEEVGEMLVVIEHALQNAIGLRAGNPFDAWLQLARAQADWGRRQGLPPLLTNFGTSLVERALIEAVCRAVDQPFTEVLRNNRLGIRLDQIHSSLRAFTPRDFLPKQPLSKIFLRHTVGLADPLVEADISPSDRLADGLPQSLAACIEAYGLRHFKIKVCGDLDADRERLQRIAEVATSHAPADYAFSLDGNEQFHELANFKDFWDALYRSKPLQSFFEHLLFVEQPLHRDVALRPDRVGVLRDWAMRPPIIIDESDSESTSLPQALQLGYAGTSHKNCKGVFKSIANYCLLAQERRQAPHRPAIMSGEDLVNIGPVALLQDLAVCASLGISSVERNGHHYFTGLSQFPRQVQQQVLGSHGDLYHASPQGWPTLTIQDGLLELASLAAAPFGVGFPLDVEQFRPLAEWRRSHNLSQDESTLS
jgi:hypothetical protein